MAEETEEFPFGTRVEIGGRTMLKPGFSLVGLTGMVYLKSPGAPDDCQTVLVDWKAHGYTPENGYEDGDLPLLVNVPREHLSRELSEEEKAQIEAEKKAKAAAKKPFAPRLKIVPENVVSQTPQTAPKKDENGDGDDKKPSLRLV